VRALVRTAPLQPQSASPSSSSSSSSFRLSDLFQLCSRTLPSTSPGAKLELCADLKRWLSGPGAGMPGGDSGGDGLLASVLGLVAEVAEGLGTAADPELRDLAWGLLLGPRCALPPRDLSLKLMARTDWASTRRRRAKPRPCAWRWPCPPRATCCACTSSSCRPPGTCRAQRRTHALQTPLQTPRVQPSEEADTGLAVSNRLRRGPHQREPAAADFAHGAAQPRLHVLRELRPAAAVRVP
jgi:hypothetical protein